MDPKSADALTAAFFEFDADKNASVAVFYGAGGAFCAGWDLKFVGTLNSEYPLGELDIPPAGPRRNDGEIPRGPLGPSRFELDKPVIAAIEGPAVAGGHRRLLTPLGRAADRRWNRPAAPYRWPGSSLRNHPHRTQGAGGRMPKHRFV
jgi:1,4-dihydroxy-2-naphthoyl-CoA synthase